MAVLPLSAWTAAALGVVLGHLIRRGVPHLLRLKDRSLPFRRPWPELLCAAAFATLSAVGAPWPAWLLTTLLVAASACDVRSKLIPDAVTVGGVPVGFVASYLEPDLVRAVPLHDLLVINAGLSFRSQWTALLLAVAGAALGLALVWAIRAVFRALARVEAMGWGDAKLLAAAGAFLGPVGVVLALALSFFLGTLQGAYSTWRTGQPHFAFGPSLALAAWLVAAGSEHLMEGVGRFQAWLLTLPMTALAAAYSLMLAFVIFLLWRLRRKSAEYEAMIEADYAEIESELDS